MARSPLSLTPGASMDVTPSRLQRKGCDGQSPAPSCRPPEGAGSSPRTHKAWGLGPRAGQLLPAKPWPGADAKWGEADGSPSVPGLWSGAPWTGWLRWKLLRLSPGQALGEPRPVQGLGNMGCLSPAWGAPGAPSRPGGVCRWHCSSFDEPTFCEHRLLPAQVQLLEEGDGVGEDLSRGQPHSP